MLRRTIDVLRHSHPLQLTRVDVNILQKRLAGHSKWANIKHIKAAKDAEKGRSFERFARMIRVAIQEGGSPSPLVNSQLKTVIDQALAKDMPMSTIERNIKKFNINDAQLKKEYVDMKTMNRVFIVIEMFSDNIAKVKMDLNTIVRKTKSLGTSMTATRHMFEEAGIITVSTKKSFASPAAFEDQLMEDAINFDAQEVENIDFESKTATFICKPREIERVKRTLMNSEYVVEDAQHIFAPNTTIKLNEDETKVYELFVQKLKAIEGVENHFDNVET